MSGHTASPWKAVKGYHGYFRIISVHAAPNDADVTDTYMDSVAISEEDAYLMAAAPDLLEALLAARERMIGSSPAIKALIEKTDAAIAKATGAA
jgi:hypothetical protein